MVRQDMESATARNRVRLRKILLGIAVAAAMSYIGYTLLSDVSKAGESLSRFSWPWLMAAALAALPMYLLKGCYQVALLDRTDVGSRSWRSRLRIYLQAQLVRYLPGKIWGLVYQAGRMSESHSVREVLLANAWQMLTTNVLAVGVISSLILCRIISPWYLMVIAPFILRRNFLDGSLSPIPRKRWMLTAILCSEWVFYFIAIWLLFHGWRHSADWILVGAWYSGASILAMLAFVVPAGLAVREAIFVMGPDIAQMDAASMAVFALVARLTFTGAELGAALIANLIPADASSR